MRSIKELTDLGISRDQMTEAEEKAWVEYWFSEYERTGFADTFRSPYDQYKDRIGQKYEVLGRCTEEDCDLECLPMWKIRFEDGFETYAHEVEICEIEQQKEGVE